MSGVILHYYRAWGGKTYYFHVIIQDNLMVKFF